MIVCDGESLRGGLRGEDPLHHRAQQRRRRSLAGHVAERKSHRAVRQVDVIVEIAANRPAGQRRRRRAEKRAGAGHLRAAAPAGSRPRSASPAPSSPSPSSRDRAWRFRWRQPPRWRASRAPRFVELDSSSSLFATVEVQHADAFVALFGRLGLVEIPDEPKRHAQHVADPERDGAHVHVRELAVEQVGHRPRLAGSKHLLGNLAAGGEAAAREHVAAAAARHLELELARGAREHDEPAFGAADVNRRIQHERQHIVQHAARSERAQAFEQRADLAEVADRGRGRRLLGMRLAIPRRGTPSRRRRSVRAGFDRRATAAVRSPDRR